MKYRIFNLAVELLPKHPLWTSQRSASLALGYTSEESLEKAESILRKHDSDYQVKIQRIDSHTEFKTLKEVSEGSSIKHLKESEAYPYCYITLF
jgi:hypothetical protein